MGQRAPCCRSLLQGDLFKGDPVGSSFLSLPPGWAWVGGGHLFGEDLGADLSALKLQRPSEGVPELGQLL